MFDDIEASLRCHALWPWPSWCPDQKRRRPGAVRRLSLSRFHHCRNIVTVDIAAVNIAADNIVTTSNNKIRKTPDSRPVTTPTSMSTPALRIEQAGRRPSQEPAGIRLRIVPHVSSAASPTTTPIPAVVRVGFQVGRNIYHYPQPGILADQTNAAVMSGVRTTFKAAQAGASTWFRLSQRLFRKLLVEEGSVRSIPGIDVERGDSTTRIVPQNCVLRPELTMLFNGLNITEGSDNFALHFPDVVTNSPVIHVLVVTSALKKTVVGLAWLLVSIICLAIGVGFGFAIKGSGSSKAANVIKLTGALWTLVSFLLGVFVYTGKR